MAVDKASQSPTEVTIIIPTLNEVGNIRTLLKRIDTTLHKANISYKIVVVDDHSSDGTLEQLHVAADKYPLTVFTKKGESGKSQSLVEAFKHVDTQFAAFLDADLQYPPEAIPQMLNMIKNGDADLVVAKRKFIGASKSRTFVSNVFRIVFGQILWGLKCDVQSGQKVFRSEIIKRIHVKTKPWTFDLEFLVASRNAGYKIGEYGVDFTPRTSGQSHVHIISTSLQIGYESVKLRLQGSHVIPFLHNNDGRPQGFHFKGKPFQPHNKINVFETAVRRFSTRQIFVSVPIILVVLAAALSNAHTALAVFIAAMTLLYFSDLLLNVLVICRSFFSEHQISVADAKIEQVRDWPRYTVFCPLYKEAIVLPQFTEAMSKLDYPADKLEVLLLLEANDTETIAVAEEMNLPSYFKIVVVPHSMPKTKPKACNYGLFQASGEYSVIYDAEDIPNPLQLKKAVIAYESSPDNIGCIQAKLNYYNWDQNLLTRLFTLEYSLWYELILPGLQSIKAPIPLGGTSNHFRTADLLKFGGWDPFNVTEDADLGIRLSKAGYSTQILDSVTLEEANSQVGNWIRQRSRWIKGYIQTYFVHTRKLETKQSRRDYFIFQLLIGGKVLSALINPLLWIMTILLIIMPNVIGDFVRTLYPGWVFYLGLVTLIGGNFLYLYNYMLGVAKRGQLELIPYAFLVPLYWMLISIATVKAIYEFIVKPFHWQKTTHGLHLIKAKQAKRL